MIAVQVSCLGAAQAGQSEDVVTGSMFSLSEFIPLLSEQQAHDGKAGWGWRELRGTGPKRRPSSPSTCQQSSPAWRPWWRATRGWSVASSARSAWVVSTLPMKSRTVVPRAGSHGLCGPSAMPSLKQNCKAWARMQQAFSPLRAQPCLGPPWAAGVILPFLHPTHWSPAPHGSVCPLIGLPSLHCPGRGGSPEVRVLPGPGAS